jgi:hypothetical protein
MKRVDYGGDGTDGAAAEIVEPPATPIGPGKATFTEFVSCLT